MIILHQVHSLVDGALAEFERQARDEWRPAIASDESRFAFFAVPTGAAARQDEAITMIACSDGAALGQLSDRIRTGDLVGLAWTQSLLRTGVATRMLKALDYDPSGIDIRDIPVELCDRAPVAYMHDFVPPTIGQNRAYVDLMRKRYMALSETELSGVVLRMSWETVWGGGPVPEMFNLSEIRSPEALLQLVGKEIPVEYKEMGSWMWEALAVRDRWTTRLVRSAPWSPIA